MVVNGYVDMHCPFVCVSDKNMHDARRCRHCIVKRICMCANPPTWISPERGSVSVERGAFASVIPAGRVRTHAAR